MRNAIGLALIVLLVSAGAQAAILDDFETTPTAWIVRPGRVAQDVSNSTEKPLHGARSLRFVQANGTVGQFGVVSEANHEDLSALKSTYIEFAINQPILASGRALTGAMQVEFGNGQTARTTWNVQETNFQTIAADAAGWWIVHLEFDATGTSTNAGATLNGTDISANVSLFTTGTVDWSGIDWVAILPNKGSGGDFWSTPTYVDTLTIGEAVPEPASALLLALGFAGAAWRRNRK